MFWKNRKTPAMDFFLIITRFQKRLHLKCFPVNFEKICWITFLQNTSGCLLSQSYHVAIKSAKVSGNILKYLHWVSHIILRIKTKLLTKWEQDAGATKAIIIVNFLLKLRNAISTTIGLNLIIGCCLYSNWIYRNL